MGAGSPNYQKLFEMGKLSKDQRYKVFGLSEIDEFEKKLKEVEKGVCDECRDKFFPESASSDGVKCESEGCDFIAKGKSEGIIRNILRMHGKVHLVKV